MRPKTPVVVVVLLLLTVAGVAYYEYAKREALRSCQISIADVSVKSLGPTSTRLEIKLNIYNPNSIPATLDRASYSLYANEVYLGNGTITRKYDIPPGSTVTIVTPFELSYPGALQTIWSYITKGGKAVWRMKGTAYIDTPLGTLSIPFDISL
jgi:LEA14-like dessication related protein